MEQIDKAVKRELFEETKLDSKTARQIGISEWFWVEKEIHHIQINYLVESITDNVVISSEIDNYKWLEKNSKEFNLYLDDFNLNMLKQALQFF